MGKIYVGIDPGKDGYICKYNDFNGSQFSFSAIPKIGKKAYDIHAMAVIFTELKRFVDLGAKIHCVLEDVHAIYGSAAGSTFEFGFGVGLIEGMLVMAGIPYTKVQPKKWQKQMFEGVAEQKKPSKSGKTMKVDTKAMAEVAAKRMFPSIDLRDTPRCKISHDGKVDSLLMCEYAKRNFK